MTASLVKYETARAALAEARSVDEVKDIRDKAEAIRAYARMAQDSQMEADAAELRLRAERRMGILIHQEKQAKRLRSGPDADEGIGNKDAPIVRIKLEDLGIDKRLSARAQKVAGIAERAFEAAVERKRQEILRARGRVSLDITGEAKKERRARREADLAQKQAALPSKKFGVILADPEWRFEPYSRESGMDRAADNHYPTSATEIIAARPVADLAAGDSILFLWATVPMLPDALGVMAAWGFAYKSHVIWNKDRLGTGYWFRNKHELLLVGTKGDIPAPAMGEQWPSVVDAPVGRHSAKPEVFLEMIEAYYPNLPKIELNRRGPARKGWAAWGNEAEPGEFNPSTGEIADAQDHPVHADGPADGAGADRPGDLDGGPGDREGLRLTDAALPPGPPAADRPGGMEGPPSEAKAEEDDPLFIPEFLRRKKPDNDTAAVGETQEVPFA